MYYRAIAWGIPLSWLFALWGLIAFIVGGTQTWGNIGYSIGYAIGFLVVLGGLEALAWWVATTGAVKFYKWEQQPWWNWSSENDVSEWPKQLGKFVDY